MELLIFKTNIESERKIRKLERKFSSFSNIKSWTIDVDDIDRVLKVRVERASNQFEVKSLVNNCGFICEELD
ncbi:MAG: hypothetical protein JKY48_00660 [Flavobacteriales bacterium]|nr:hypothetical protein [Flavobacteriales bacterium]